MCYILVYFHPNEAKKVCNKLVNESNLNIIFSTNCYCYLFSVNYAWAIKVLTQPPVTDFSSVY